MAKDTTELPPDRTDRDEGSMLQRLDAHPANGQTTRRMFTIAVPMAHSPGTTGVIHRFL